MTGPAKHIGQFNQLPPVDAAAITPPIPKKNKAGKIRDELQTELYTLFSGLVEVNTKAVGNVKLAEKIAPIFDEELVGQNELNTYKDVSGLISQFNKILKEIQNITNLFEKIQTLSQKSPSTHPNKPVEEFQLKKSAIDKSNAIGKITIVSIGLANEVNNLSVKILNFLENSLPIEGVELPAYKSISGLIAGSLSKISLISDLIHLVRATNLLNEELDRLKELKNTNPAIPQADLDKIEKELKKLKFNVEKLKENFFFKVVGSLPSLAENVYSYVKYIGKIANNAKVGAGISIAGSVIDLISSAREIYEKNKQFDLHAKYTEDLKPLKIEIPVDDSKVPEADSKILNKIREKRSLRLEEEKKTFDPWLQELITVGDFDHFINELKKTGLALDSSIDSFEKVTGEIKQKLLEDKVERNTTLTTIAKSQLRERLQAQEKINRSFFSFKFTQSQINFAIAVITAASAITMTVMIAGGTVFPPVFILALSFLGAAQTFGSLGIGMAHLYQNKPNLAKTYFKLVQVDLLFTKIPHLFSNWQLTRAREKSEQLVEDLNGKTDPAAKNSLQQEKNKLDASIKEYEESYEKYDKKMQRLKNKISKARKKDFELKTGFNAFSEDLPKYVEKKGVLYEERKNLVKLSKEINISEELKNKMKQQIDLIDKKIAFFDQRINAIKGESKDEFQIIAEALIKGEFWKDPEAADFLKKYGGTELGEKLTSKDIETNPSLLSQKLRSFILKNSEQILNWLEEQQIEEVSLS